MRWQKRLFERFVHSDVPESCDLPTGLGKTFVIPIWLLALVRQADSSRVKLPRRLVYIVNRRTVVDQATQAVEEMRKRLLQPYHPDWPGHGRTLQEMAGTLRSLCATEGVPLAVSTLRGELADNEDWKADPARPAIIIGTIDMIGSKLLFSGYGDGRYYRAHHAGLIGHDALIVHDEAHLTPVFSELLRRIALEQEQEAKQNGGSDGIARPVRVVELSATSRVGATSVFRLEEEDQDDEVVQVRLSARKRLYLHPAREDGPVAQIVELSKGHEGARAKVLIYVRSPEQARQVVAKLAKSLGGDSNERIALLTGTIRGHERDRLVRTNTVFRALLDSKRSVDETVFLVSTSAGEVGIDLDADHLVCDVTTLDALIQRLGRVNRRGGARRRARVDAVGDAPAKDNSSTVDKAVVATQELLRDWGLHPTKGLDVSPGRLRQLLKHTREAHVAAAFSPRPAAPTLTDILLDAWSMTSVDSLPGRPDVAPFLHGLTHDPPETYVAWRQEIRILADAQLDSAALGEWFGACRIESRERLRDRTDRVREALKALLENHRKQTGGLDFPVVLLSERGEAHRSRLSEIVERGFSLAYRTVVLPVEVAGLDENGMLDAEALRPRDGLALDVAEPGEVPVDNRRERWLRRRLAGVERFERLLTGEIVGALPEAMRERATISLVEPEEGDAEVVELILLETARRSALDNPETASALQTLVNHTDAIATQMAMIAAKLRLQRFEKPLLTAARWHDRGKDRPVWQRYARKSDASQPLAKSTRYLHPRALGGYRHEFGSLLETMEDADLERNAERDLVLHLVAAHHGWARPHFETRSYDNTRTSAENERALSEAMRRFGRLQERFGRWGLAWLESLLRCADIAASRRAAESVSAVARQEAGT